MISTTAAHAPNTSAYCDPAGNTPVTPRISRPMPAVMPTASDTIVWPRM